MNNEHQTIAKKADNILSLAKARLGDEYYYNSLTLCVIDSVFSIAVQYASVQAVVHRYCTAYGLDRFRADRSQVPNKDTQEPISGLCARYDGMEPQRMAEEIYQNHQRTSARSGILKADAVNQFAQILRAHGIEYFQDIGTNLPTGTLERDIKAIRGQGSGISLQYFWMLAGTDDLIKPDRMILRFLGEILERPIDTAEATPLIAGATEVLQRQYAHLTPRLLDHAIWEYQRDR